MKPTLQRRRRRATAGFTMIEVMVSMLLTAIAASGIIALYVVETRASGYSRSTTEATILAQDQLESLRTSSITGTASTAGLNEHGLVVPGGRFTRDYTVTPGIDFDEVLVNVSWLDDGITKTVTLRSRRNL